LMIGGVGADRLQVGAGQAVLIGGTTLHDPDLVALAALSDEWAGPSDYLTRVSNLSGVTAGPNAPFALTKDSVKDDDRVDTLLGGAGLDWFFLTAEGSADLFGGLGLGEEVILL
jgi:hypothetical protein